MFDFDDGTFLQRDLKVYKGFFKEAFCKIADIRVHSIPGCKGRIVSYSVMIWEGFRRPEGGVVSDYAVYKSPITGITRIAFTCKPFAFKDKAELFAQIRLHFISSECAGERNVNEEDALVVGFMNYRPIHIEKNGRKHRFNKVFHLEEYLLDESMVLNKTKNAITFEDEFGTVESFNHDFKGMNGVIAALKLQLN